MSVFADIRIFQSSAYASLTAPVKKTSNGYFIVNLPANLKTGYYYICDIGLFKYEGSNDSEPISEEENSAAEDAPVSDESQTSENAEGDEKDG